ncbi:autoinducer 2 ABC transporter substrate-binding protein [Treponema phagedenis]|uniref:Periplasmic binding protein domain-containing protein n=1 Tax=Treponema phagedenis TaxID=162 RepID=A0A0B7GT29_TREPH|nr:autoinducer 2 ABC transporter substrate-binding protein [Treponema phagedenis]QEJ96337.1 autoinducer 2 ABC transporter substrate-binding protein [Treponema phagedenis]QEK02135.1 autoinducer 2 ABC transporter substrate-binding protein [Treponema phagedenis]QEK07390.1 autoinducer 2 ABC transporter substrate-binding protein [Treponema phagedenis]QSH94717.1 autoinducer 2 ABC transporter substrate-binding protein [Treponema phagedenis]QSI00453.1 autoinducer 2 ABC transporter substrate-binding pr
MKSKMKFLLAVSVALGIIFSACTKSEEPAGSEGGEGKKNWKIAVVPKDSTNAWFVRMEQGVKKYASDTGLNVFQKGPAKTDGAMQVQVVQDLIGQGVDALCVVPVDPAALEPVLGEAMSKGIVVITHEGSTVQNTMYDIESFNNAGYGAFIMDNLAKAMGEKGVYTTMVAHVTNASHNEWADGAVAQQKAKYPQMTLLESDVRVETEDNTERAYERAKELFKKYPDLKGIVGTSSKDAPGTARAIEELGLKDKVFTCGTGMPNESRQYLKDGSLVAITLWDPADAGYAMATLARKVLEKESIENGVNLGVKGYENMTFAEGSKKILLGAGWIVITKDNVDDYDF